VNLHKVVEMIVSIKEERAFLIGAHAEDDACIQRISRKLGVAKFEEAD
jgi:hypothetical protein